jgi:ParB family chromosome partitioning protein
MAKNRQALGRGLSALLSDPNNDLQNDTQKQKELLGNVVSLSMEWIEVNPFQPRIHFDKQSLNELAQSISQLGIVQPITVRRVDHQRFQIISGERRFRASQLAGLEEVPAFVRMANDQEMLEMALVENIQRKDLDAIEIALSYQRLIEECSLTQEELSSRVGKKRSTIANYLRLLKLPPLIQAGIRDEMIAMGHARALVNIDDEDLQLDIYTKAVEDELSVREVERLVQEAREGGPVSRKRSKRPLPYAMQLMNEKMSTHINARTEILRNKKGQGRIVIHFGSDHELKRISDLLSEE